MARIPCYKLLDELIHPHRETAVINSRLLLIFSSAAMETAPATIWGRKRQLFTSVSDSAIIYNMNSKHRKTLEAIYNNPVSGNIKWKRIESLFIAVGCEIIEGRGPRITVVYGTDKVAFHRPHPRNEALRYRVHAARDFLTMIGVKP